MLYLLWVAKYDFITFFFSLASYCSAHAGCLLLMKCCRASDRRKRPGMEEETTLHTLQNNGFSRSRLPGRRPTERSLYREEKACYTNTQDSLSNQSYIHWSYPDSRASRRNANVVDEWTTTTDCDRKIIRVLLLIRRAYFSLGLFLGLPSVKPGLAPLSFPDLEPLRNPNEGTLSVSFCIAGFILYHLHTVRACALKFHYAQT
jgi:hypothetical protein